MSSQPVPRHAIGPLHHLVHRQLLLACEREAWVGDTAAARLGPGAQQAVHDARVAHPLELAGHSLEDLVGRGHPHDVLDELVARFHRREAAVYRALIERHGDEGEVVLRLAAWDHGIETGRRIAESQERPVAGPSATFDLLGETVLEGMPCRSTVTVLREERQQVAWKHEACPYQRDWERSGLALATGCNVLSAWIRGFAAGVDGGVEYRRPKAIALGDPRCEHELVRLD